MVAVHHVVSEGDHLKSCIHHPIQVLEESKSATRFTSVCYENILTHELNFDHFGLRRPIIDTTFQPKSTTSILARVCPVVKAGADLQRIFRGVVDLVDAVVRELPT